MLGLGSVAVPQLPRKSGNQIASSSGPLGLAALLTQAKAKAQPKAKQKKAVEQAEAGGGQGNYDGAAAAFIDMLGKQSHVFASTNV